MQSKHHSLLVALVERDLVWHRFNRFMESSGVTLDHSHMIEMSPLVLELCGYYGNDQDSEVADSIIEALTTYRWSGKKSLQDLRESATLFVDEIDRNGWIRPLDWAEQS